MTMYGQHVDKNMFLAECKGTEFEILKTFEAVKHGEACKA
jgi:urea transport system substrate-binding protein